MAVSASQVNLRVGLDYIVDNPDYTKDLAVAITHNDVSRRKQVLELLAALCVYGKGDGYRRVLETLEQYKTAHNARYRFAILVDELKKAALSPAPQIECMEYASTILALINCLIMCAPTQQERLTVRNQLVGLKLLDVLQLLKLRRDAGDFNHTGIPIQLDAFEAQRDTDDAELNGPDGVDLNSHLEVFYAILRQVSLTPQQVPFLEILQNLLRIDYTQPISDLIWDTARILVHRATLIENQQDADKLLQQCRCFQRSKSMPAGGATTPLRMLSPPPDTPMDWKQTPIPKSPLSPKIPVATATVGPGVGVNPTPLSPASQGGAPPAPPPPPPPPPLPQNCVPPLQGGVPPPPPPIPPLGKGSQPIISAAVAPAPLLPQQLTPKPKNKMKTLNWCKIPTGKILQTGNNNLWSLIAAQHKPNESVLDFESMEGLFCQQSSTPVLSRKAPAPKKAQELNLLDSKRSLNINIFLKQFRSTNDEIIALIRRGAHDEMGVERLKGLLKILPELGEVEMLKSYDGDINRLGAAEQFLLDLIQVPDYKLRIECLLLKEEFSLHMGHLEPSIQCVRKAAQELQDSTKLHEVLYMILVAGNFLNSGGYAGNAAGFRMMSLLKVTDMRANRPGMNLIHYVALEAERKGLHTFINDVSALEEAARLSIDALKAEVGNLSQRLTNVSNMVSNTNSDLKDQMKDFLNFADQHVANVQRQLEAMESLRRNLAEFLCEDIDTFKLEECFRIFYNFCVKFKSAIEDNAKRIQQETKAESRRRQREEQTKRLSVEFASGSESDVMDMLLGDIRSGILPQMLQTGTKVRRSSSLRRSGESVDDDISAAVLNIANSPRLARRGGAAINSSVTSLESPDVTPTGSLQRKRRNRASADMDNASLLEYLKQSEPSEDRERTWIRSSLRRLKPEAPESLQTLHEATNKIKAAMELPENDKNKLQWRHSVGLGDFDQSRKTVEFQQPLPTRHQSMRAPPYRPPEDTDTSTGGESPIQRRRAFYSLRESPSRTRVMSPNNSRSDYNADHSRRSLRAHKQSKRHKGASDDEEEMINSDDENDSESSFDRFAPQRKTTRRVIKPYLEPILKKPTSPVPAEPPSSQPEPKCPSPDSDTEKKDKSLRARLARKLHSLTGTASKENRDDSYLSPINNNNSRPTLNTLQTSASTPCVPLAEASSATAKRSIPTFTGRSFLPKRTTGIPVPVSHSSSQSSIPQKLSPPIIETPKVIESSRKPETVAPIETTTTTHQAVRRTGIPTRSAPQMTRPSPGHHVVSRSASAPVRAIGVVKPVMDTQRTKPRASAIPTPSSNSQVPAFMRATSASAARFGNNARAHSTTSPTNTPISKGPTPYRSRPLSRMAV